MSSPSTLALNEPKAPSTVRYLDTASAYDLWSEIYDTDGNFLQALDTIEMETLLPEFLDKIESPKPWRLVDLGCGTGRNTLSLLRIPDAIVIGLELSPKMLDVARSRINNELGQMEKAKRAQTVALEVFDMIKQPQPPGSAMEADAVISTLVLEHIPADIFFQTVSRLLKDGGKLLVTNMHSDMGSKSQAGFVEVKSGDKIRPKSFVHRAAEVVEWAKAKGFQLEGEVLERGVDAARCDALGARAKKWLGVMVWYGMVFRKSGEGGFY